ncbi:MAG TPA: GFA family protein [Caulobacteraceae bacterium]|nr:GFA family protein [Caulobacteraceae bacterium]
MLKGACLCGEVEWTFDADPGSATACNCTACRRYGVLWIYGHEGEDVALRGPVRGFARGDKKLEFLFCPTCGNLAAWRGLSTDKDGRVRMAVNIRLADPDSVAALPVDHFDGFAAFEDLGRDGRCVKDMWF